MKYIKTTLSEEIVIRKIVTVHYFEYAKNYVFEGEQHDFWEFLYVDKGEIEVMADAQGYKLTQGEIIFHKPNEFHNVWANGKVAPNLIVVAFECRSEAMTFFENKLLSIGDYEKNLLAHIIREAKKAFSSPFNDPLLTRLERNPTRPFGCEQLIKINLELLLISLFRKDTSIQSKNRISSAVKERSDEDMVKKIIAYLRDRLHENIRFEDVRQFSNLSRTNLKVLFKDKTGMSVMEFFRNIKVEEAKKMIREEHYNFTEISKKLGYDSIHYFSRQFKKITGMSPSEYASSVKVKI